MREANNNLVANLRDGANEPEGLHRSGRKTRDSLTRRILWLLLTLGSALPQVTVAQHREPFQEYEKSIKAAQTIEPLGADAFGDSTNLYSGATEFKVTDISIPGNSALPVALGRQLTVENREGGTGPLAGFGNWDLDVPHISGTFSAGMKWSVGAPGAGNQHSRCSLAIPPRIDNNVDYSVDEIWSGYQLHIPGQGDQELLAAVSSGPAYPQPDAQIYPWITKDLSRVRCITPLQDGYPGEGYLLITSNGTKYSFNRVVERPMIGIKKPWMEFQSGGQRKHIYMLATRVEDRFGNYVNYVYDGDKLQRIESNDGRLITVYYTGNTITSATAHGKTWSYQYAGSSLLQYVVRPDASRWTYAYNSNQPELSYDLSLLPIANYEAFCFERSVPSGSFEISIGHPAGSNALFNFGAQRHYRVHVPFFCSKETPAGAYQEDVSTDKLAIPNYFDTLALFEKTLSGPGIPTQQTGYDYGIVYQDGFCRDPAPCVDNLQPDGSSTNYKWVTISEADGTFTKQRFGVMFDTNEGMLLEEQKLSSNGTVLKSTKYDYVADSEAPVQNYPLVIGHTFRYDGSSGKMRPQRKRVIALDGVDFKWDVEKNIAGTYSFSALAQPTKIIKSSSLGDSKTESLQYFYDQAKWVFGDVASLTDGETGKVIFSTDYDAAKALPWRQYNFGGLLRTIEYGSDGTVSKVINGRNYETVLTNWHRGVPKNIAYPTGFGDSAGVNDLGWITSTTDENGFSTAYSYDGIGRINQIAYPTGDAVAWTPLGFEFRALTASDWRPPGINVGQWRRSTWKNSYAKIEYMDTLWRPVLVHEYDASNVGETLRSTSMTYDVKGRLIFQSYPSSEGIPPALGTRTFYDALDRVIRVEANSEQGVLATQTDYLPGLQVRTTNPRNIATTVTRFQAFDEPSTNAPLSISLPSGITVSIDRDDFGKAKTITRGGMYAGTLRSAVRRYVYDANERLCQTIDPESGTTTIAYDAADNVSWTASGPIASGITAASCQYDRDHIASTEKSERTYDAANRLLTATFPDGIDNATYSYYPDGQMQSVAGGGGTWNYSYNKRRLLTTETLTFYGPYPIVHAYDTNGSLLSVTSPNGTSVNYAPNALGQATQAGIYASGVKYYPNGGIKQFVYGNQVVHTTEQNGRLLPQRSLDVIGSIEHLDDRYSFDANGNVSSIVDDDGNLRNTTRTMTYDNLDRLTQANGIWNGASYAYDPLDNIVSNTIGLAGLTYIYDSNNRLSRLDRSGGGSYNYTYDVRGNVTSDGRNAYTFSRANRLTGIAGKDSYQYDGLGRRIVVWRADNTAQVPVYGQDGVLRYIADNRKGGATSPIYLAGSQIAESFTHWTTGATTVKYIHTDALGSPVAKSDVNGIAIPSEAIEYAPYGAPINRPVDEQGYTGHAMDQSSGLIYAQQRYYDPYSGRFLTLDPSRTDPNTGTSFNRYNYANNNPYLFKDPDGRDGACFYGPSQCGMRELTPTQIQQRNAAVGTVGGLAIDFTPGLGDAKGVYEAYKNPTTVNVSAAAIGLLPFLGDVAAKLIRGANKISDVTKGAPDFIVSPGGTAFPVPPGSTGPIPVINPAGKQTGVQFTGGAGGANGQVSTMRIMDPNAKNPTGYVKYENGQSPPQGVDPYSGRTVSPDKAHHPID